MRASAGAFFDRVPLRALANALLSAGNTTDYELAADHRQPVAGADRRAGISRMSLERCRADVTARQPHDHGPNLQNAYSRQASVEVERQVGARDTVSVGYQYLRGTAI